MPGKNWLHFFTSMATNRLGRGSRQRRCAVFIDGDNVLARFAEHIVHFASSLGTVTTIEMFANFASTSKSGWAATKRQHGIIGLQQFRTAPGKNSADAALIVRAMDLLHTVDIDDYVIVSSNSDFSPLAHRIRRSGSSVHAIGSSDAPPTLRLSCTSFQTFDELSGTKNAEGSTATSKAWSLQPADAETALLTALVRIGGARGWVDPGALGSELQRTRPGFDPRVYSRQTLTDLCAALDSIDVDRSSHTPSMRVALRKN